MDNSHSNFNGIFGDYFSAYKNTSKYKDDSMMEMMLRRQEFEKNLDDMWTIYKSGNVKQIVNYQKGVDNIKNAGLKVLRNSSGKHKIVNK